MDNNSNNDKTRFDKLYQLLGDDVNTIYNNTPNSNMNNNVNNNPNEVNTTPIFNDVKNVFEDEPKEKVEFKDVFSIFDDDGKYNNEYYQEVNTVEETKEPQEIYIEPSKVENNNGNIENNKNEYHNKTLIGNREFDDGLDTIEDKMTILSFLANKKVLLVLLILTLIVVTILVVKAFRFGKVVDLYNEYANEMEKEEESTNIYGGDKVDSETLGKAAASELVECITSPVNVNELPDSVSSIIKEINSYYNKSSDYFAFAYKDLFTGFTVTYNENGNVFAASTIKAPVNIYLYEMASEDKIDLDRELTYTNSYYNEGTGVLKNKQLNTKYPIRELSMYAIVNSDNAAHNMLMDEFGRKNIKNFWQAKGTNIILTGNDNWGLINAHDAMIYMKELYTFYINNQEYGTELMNNFLNAKTKFIKGKNDYKVANKTGWSGTAQHDIAIVFADNPYIVVALSNLGYNNNYMDYFNKVNDLAYNLHQEYWTYKMNKCVNIKQYQ